MYLLHEKNLSGNFNITRSVLVERKELVPQKRIEERSLSQMGKYYAKYEQM